MRAIQVTFDRELLRRIDALPEVRKAGRSAFLRRIAAAYLRARRNQEIREAYRRGYGAHPVAPGEFEVDPETIAWPEP
jgi:metal-responsive CopG/Arc/MetJ family transcriptional regulator